MSWVTTAAWTIASIYADQTVRGNDKQRKAVHTQQDAIKAAQQADTTQAAESQTMASADANAKLAADKRARQASVLSLGGPTSVLGGGNVLSQGGMSATQPTATTSVLGGGARANVGAF